MKDIERTVDNLDEYLRETATLRHSGVFALINMVRRELEKLERVSQEWVEDNSVYASSDGVTEEYVHVDDLQNLLVPKQELPVVPKFVAEWIEMCKEFIDYDGSTINIFDSQHETDTNLPALNTVTEKKRAKVYDWIADYPEKYARAWLDGYTVEKEMKYYVSDIEGNILLWKTSKGVRKTNSEVKLGQYDDWAILFTEQEIKDYDERYLAFAEPVEEME